jgi:predicted Zn-dependent protease
MVRAGDTRGAEALIQQGLRNQPGDAALQQALAALLLQSQGVETAMAAAERLSQQANARPASLNLPGDLLVTARRPEEAARAYAAAAKIAASPALALREAAAWRTAGKPAEAQRVLRSWLANAPDDVDSMLLLAQLDMEANRLPEAELLLKAAVARRAQDVVALNNLAWVIGQRGGVEAQALAERAFFLSPNPDTADTLGWILARNGKAGQAVPLLRRSAAARGADPAAAFRLAYALRATGAKDEAMAVLTPVLAGTDIFPERAEAVRLLAELRGQR